MKPELSDRNQGVYALHAQDKKFGMTRNDQNASPSIQGNIFGLAPITSLVPLTLLVAAFCLTGVLLAPSGEPDVVVLRGTGVAVASLLVLGLRCWPAVFCGALAGQMLIAGMGYANVGGDGRLPSMLIQAGASALQAVAGAGALIWLFGFPLRLNRARQILFAVLVVIPVTSTILPTAVVLLIKVTTPDVPAAMGWHWSIWWMGNVIGALLAIPVALLGPWSRLPVLYWRGTPMPRFSGQAIFYLALSVLATFIAWHQVSRLGNQSDEAQFEMLARDSAHALRHRLEMFTYGLSGGVGLFQASNEVTAQDWRDFAAAYAERDGLTGLGFIVPVPPGGGEAFLAKSRADGIEDMHITSPRDDEEMFVIKYVEPIEWNSAARGLNVAAEENRRMAAITARDTGRVTISRPVTLVQDQKKGSGFLLLAPLYDLPGTPPTVMGRRGHFVGWIYAPIIVDRMMATLLDHTNPQTRISLYDGPHIAEAQKFYQSSAPASAQPKFRYVERLNIYGQTWTVVWESTPALEARLWNIESLSVLLVGLSFSTLLAVFLISVMRREELVRATVARRTRELATQVEENRSIIETALTKIALLDDAGNVLRVNDALLRLLQLDEHEILGKPFSTLLRGQLDEYFSLPRKSELPTTYRGELAAESRDGQALMLDVQVNPWRNSDGRRRYTVVMRNITEVRRISDQLRTTQHRLDLALTGARIGVFDIDLHSGKSVVSRTWLDLLGLGNEAATEAQALWLQRIHPDDLQTVQEADQACIEGRAERSVSEYRIRMDDGSWRWMRSNAVGEDRDETGRAWRLIGVQTDVTDQRQLDEMKKQFVSTVSHELRTPLTSINGSLSLLLNTMAAGIPDPAKRMLTIAQKNCDRLIHLVNDILDMEKLDGMLQRPELVTSDISALIRNTILVNQPFATRFDVAYRLVADSPGAIVRLDENRFHQVMANLLSNAAKFSPRGAQVDVRLERGPKYVTVSVSNAGKGIPPGFREQMFKPFSQVDSSANREAEGSGLGLHIAKRIVEQMGGQIDFRSEPGVLTTFWFTLPLETPDEHPPAPPEGNGPRTGQPAHVLHVESDTEVSALLATAFGAEARLTNALNESSARKLLSETNFDLVVLGWGLETGDGRDLLRDVAIWQPGVPVVTLTADAQRRSDPRVLESFIKSSATLSNVAARCLEIMRANPPPKTRACAG
ncbi:hypothetical protein GCM10007291_01710 [Gemmobacter nanjingensis]|uniref:histidine kinase n=2 Tax=Gemmobacter nanjingensis TaxID=488454 RepID=A0ABQ3F6C4_9RHOB|nr:hypothetical protein GCM10007291_01710 [Gemmobacter nanjingensis]